MGTSKQRSDIIRTGDKVLVLDSRKVIRVGYPKTPEDYVPRAKELLDPVLAKELRNMSPDHLAWIKVIRQMAYALAKSDGFGGPDRTVHLTAPDPDLVGCLATVGEVRMHQVGRYYPPRQSGGYYEGDYDYEPGGLGGPNAGSVRVVELYRFEKDGRAVYPQDAGGFRYFSKGYENNIWLPVTHLQKLEKSNG